MSADKFNTAIVLASELFQLVSDPDVFKKYKNNPEVQKKILSKFSDMAEVESAVVINQLFEKYRHINLYYKDTQWAQKYPNDEGIQKGIRRDLLQFFSIISGQLPSTAFSTIVPDLCTFGDLHDDPDITNLIFEFSAKLKDPKAFEFCKTHILNSIDYERHKIHIFNGKLDRLTEVTLLFDDAFNFVLSLMPQIFENLPNDTERNNFASLFRNYFYNLIKRNPSMMAKVFPALVQTTERYARQALIQTLIMAGSLPEAETNLFTHLVDTLTSSEAPNHAKDAVLQILKVITQEQGKADRGKILTVILKKANTLNGLDKTAIEDLFASLFQILGQFSPQWREAVDIISSKFVFDIDLAAQRTYVEGKLKEYGLADIEHSYERFIKSCERDGEPPLETLRKVYEGVINYLANQLEGGVGGNMFDKSYILEARGLLKTTEENSETLNPEPHNLRHHSELNYTYNLYALLSHYGSHPGPIDELQFSLYVQTISWLYFLFKRYEGIS